MSDPNIPPPPGGGVPPGPPPGPPPGQPPPPGGYGGGGGFAPPPAQPYQPGPAGVPGGQALADPLKRILSLILDSVLLWVVSIPIYIIVGGTFSGFGSSFALRGLLAGVVVSFGYFAYFAFLIGIKGQTLGGMVLKIKVVGVNGAPATQEQAYKRAAINLLQLVPCIGPLAVFVLFIWGLVNLFSQSLKQTPWDLFAETIAVDAP